MNNDIKKGCTTNFPNPNDCGFPLKNGKLSFGMNINIMKNKYQNKEILLYVKVIVINMVKKLINKIEVITLY